MADDWHTENAPYWRRHYGIGRPWQPTEGGRRGCMLMLLGGLAFVVLLLLVGLLIALLETP